jgi:hypothetical protein
MMGRSFVAPSMVRNDAEAPSRCRESPPVGCDSQPDAARSDAGHFPKISERDLPVTLGRDVSGVIEEGSKQREVMALLEWTHGAYAEFVALPRALCILKPRTLSMDEAAAKGPSSR